MNITGTLTEKDGMTSCPQCGCSLKSENLERHLGKVHKTTVQDAQSKQTSNTKTRSTGLSTNMNPQFGKKLSKKERRELRKGVEVNKAEARKLILQSRKRRNAIAASLIVFVLIAVVYSTTYLQSEGDGDKSPGGTAVQNSAQSDIRIPVSEFTDEAKYYRYDDDGVELRFFGVRGSDEDEHIAYDACDVCYDAKKGYTQNGEVMTCNNCGQEFEINSLGTDNDDGGCWPSHLNLTKENDEIVVKIEDLKEKRYLFE